MSSSAFAVLRLACPVGQSLSLRQLSLTLVVGFSIMYFSSLKWCLAGIISPRSSAVERREITCGVIRFVVRCLMSYSFLCFVVVLNLVLFSGYSIIPLPFFLFSKMSDNPVFNYYWSFPSERVKMPYILHFHSYSSQNCTLSETTTDIIHGLIQSRQTRTFIK